jgi:hypothetical protein
MVNQLFIEYCHSGEGFDKRHPGVVQEVVQEVLDIHPPAGGEVVDDDDVVVLC